MFGIIAAGVPGPNRRIRLIGRSRRAQQPQYLVVSLDPRPVGRRHSTGVAQRPVRTPVEQLPHRFRVPFGGCPDQCRPAPGALLVIDDIQIPTVNNLYAFLNQDLMFELLEELEGKTAFFRRTREPVFNPLGDNWWQQEYNKEAYEPETSFTRRLLKPFRKLFRN